MRQTRTLALMASGTAMLLAVSSCVGEPLAPGSPSGPEPAARTVRAGGGAPITVGDR